MSTCEHCRKVFQQRASGPRLSHLHMDVKIKRMHMSKHPKSEIVLRKYLLNLLKILPLKYIAESNLEDIQCLISLCKIHIFQIFCKK